jgi:hypothetical protein
VREYGRGEVVREFGISRGEGFCGGGVEGVEAEKIRANPRFHRRDAENAEKPNSKN